MLLVRALLKICPAYLCYVSRQAYLSKKLVLTFYVGEQLQLAFLRNFIKGNRDVKNDSVHIALEKFFMHLHGCKI